MRHRDCASGLGDRLAQRRGEKRNPPHHEFNGVDAKVSIRHGAQTILVIPNRDRIWGNGALMVNSTWS